MSETPVRGSLGALLFFVRERVMKAEFGRVSKSIPNADHIMRQTRLNGIVNGPLDDIADYEASLASLGIGQPLASQPGVAAVLVKPFDRNALMQALERPRSAS